MDGADTQQHVLEVEQLCASHGQTQVLFDVSLRIARGRIFGLMGPNGSGKSTLVRCLAGLKKPERGHIRIAGCSLASDLQRAKSALGFAPNPEALPTALSIRQCLSLVAMTRANSERADIPEATLAQAEQLRCAQYLDAPIANLSLGTRQKVSVLIALMDAPPLIVLDEVFNGLDARSSFALKQILQSLCGAGSGVLLATHGLELAYALVEELVVLEQGKVTLRFDADEYAAIKSHGPDALERTIVSELQP